MASTDWTSLSNGTGSFAIVANGTAPSLPDVMQVSTGGMMFQNITGGTFRDSAVSAWQLSSATNGAALLLALRSLDNTTFSAAPATYFLASIYVQTAVINVTIEAIVNGVVTQIVTANVSPVFGAPVNTWQQFEFLSLNSGTDILLRINQWNGAVFDTLVDAAAPIASFPTLNAAGSCRFGGLRNTNALLIDDVTFYSLA